MKDAMGHGSNGNGHLAAAVRAKRASEINLFGHNTAVPVSGGEPHGLVATAAKQLANHSKFGSNDPAVRSTIQRGIATRAPAPAVNKQSPGAKLVSQYRQNMH